MALKFHVVERRDMRQDAPEGATLHYGQVRTSGTTSFEEICEDVSSRSTASSGDIKLVINEVVKTMANHLKQGRVVQLGECGNFRMSAGSSGREKAEDFNASCFKSCRIIFSAGSMLRDACGKVGFEKLDVRVKAVDVPCDLPHAI